MKPPNTLGIVLNALAVVAAVAAFPYLFMPLIELGFVGLVMAAPVAVVVYAIGFVLVDVGPLVGFALALAGKARAFTIVTGALSLVSLLGLVAFVALAKTQIDLDHDGRARGPKPAGCKPKVTDATAIGRPCDPDAGVAPAGNCPAEHWCSEQIVDHPETNMCRVYCSHDCECPAHTRCIYNFCEKR